MRTVMRNMWVLSQALALAPAEPAYTIGCPMPRYALGCDILGYSSYGIRPILDAFVGPFYSLSTLIARAYSVIGRMIHSKLSRSPLKVTYYSILGRAHLNVHYYTLSMVKPLLANQNMYCNLRRSSTPLKVLYYLSVACFPKPEKMKVHRNIENELSKKDKITAVDICVQNIFPQSYFAEIFFRVLENRANLAKNIFAEMFLKIFGKPVKVFAKKDFIEKCFGEIDLSKNMKDEFAQNYFAGKCFETFGNRKYISKSKVLVGHL
jgi:hypothetical protein